MKKKLIFSALGFLLSVFNVMGQTPENAPVKLRVASYNVGHFNQGLKGGLEVRGKGIYPKNKAITGAFIKQELYAWRKWIGEQSLDIFGVQEWNGYFDQDRTYIAADELLKPYYNNIHFGKEHTWIHNGIATNYKLTNLRTKYSFGDYYALIGEMKLANKTIHVISMHIPWSKEGHAPGLDSLMTDLKKYEYFICFGDMNATDAEILRFRDAGFNLANGGNQGWFATAASGLNQNLMKDAPDKHIDNIITSKNIKIMNVSAPRTGLNDMDHLPIIADVVVTWE